MDETVYEAVHLSSQVSFAHALTQVQVIHRIGAALSLADS